jgi:hypothetical protein
MVKKLFIFIATILVATSLPAQKPFKKNTIYGELGGNGLVLSANYERQLGHKPGVGVHIGIGIGGIITPSYPWDWTICLILEIKNLL